MAAESPPSLAHMVYFTLKDDSDAAQNLLVEACKKYLDNHAGTLHFSAGCRAVAYQRPVNNTQFHVALHLVFDSEAAHDTYQTSPRHQEFIAENRDNWAQVQVFDSLI
ncbi:MAG: Dabb family protein [Planctomycetales bacterium]|nr:Dabb family protein [Planctomycetales bacterium]